MNLLGWFAIELARHTVMCLNIAIKLISIYAYFKSSLLLPPQAFSEFGIALLSWSLVPSLQFPALGPEKGGELVLDL